MLFDDPATLEPDDILEWYWLCSAGLVQERKKALTNLEIGSTGDLVVAALIGATEEEIFIYFSLCQQELDLCTVLTLIAAAEARVRLDFAKRVDTGTIDFLATRFRLLRSQRADEWAIPLYENGIMDVWKDYIALNAIDKKDRLLGTIGALKSVLPIRHWVAHGRSWLIKRDVRSYPPAVVARIVVALYASLREITGNVHLMDFV